MAKRVAVVGLSFRFPSTDTQKYWNDLLEGKDLVTQVEAGRWSHDAYLHPAKDHPGTSYTFSAGSIGDVSRFDADFFGISPREAALMDPQQRLLLELCWEAIENAGIRPSALRGSDCGVYIGIASADYSYRLAEDFNALDSSFATGNTASIAANRLSYVFDLHGPSMAVDTACSSSLVAFHQACRAIVNGEISQAIAGGVSLHLHPYGFITFSKASMLSPNGRCRVFDAEGDGYVRSEGGGLFLLKDYEQAVADGDSILAVVAGTAVNTDGRKSGLTVPNADAQVTLMRQVYDRAGIDPADIDYIEAHGTGTAVGDPIETRAIGMALGRARGQGSPLLIGSVKSNLGHLEAASGVAGLVKAIYALRHRVVPATIGIRKLNPNIQFDDWNIEVVTRTRKLRNTGILTVGVNSFGFGGANAHAILQTPPKPEAMPAAQLAGTTAIPVIISGRTAAALNDAARGMAAALRAHPPRTLYDVAYSAAKRRDWHQERAVVYGNDAEAIACLLEQFAAGEAPKHHVSAGQRIVNALGPVFVYSGNGSQWAGMGRRLMGDHLFAEAIAEIDTLFHKLAGWSLADELRRNDGPNTYQRTEIAQPALFAVQVGITRMLAQRGIQPVAVVGHSVGEVAAAWASGALTLADAITVIFHRSSLQGMTKGIGRMAAIGVDGVAAAALISELELDDLLCVAGSNSQRGATLAGDADALAALGEVLTTRSVFYRQLDLDYAFHSSAMDSLEAPLLEVLGDIRPAKSNVPFYSAVTGGLLDGTQLNASYWWNNIRQPVLFEQAMTALTAQGFNLYTEIGPHPVLRSYVNDALKARALTGRVAITSTRGDDEPARVRDAAGQMLISGATVDWSFLFPWAGRHMALPTYPWQREHHWHPVTAESLGQLTRSRIHELLGYRSPQNADTWENQLDTKALTWLGDHVVGDATVFPGSGFGEIALAAALQWEPGQFADVEEIEIQQPLLLDSASKLMRLTLDSSDGRFSIRGKDVGSTDPWIDHASGRVLRNAGALLLNESVPTLPGRAPDFSGDDHVALTRAAGLEYGPAFQAILHGWLEAPGIVHAILRPNASLEDSLAGSLLHPALLDCTFQLIIHMLKDDAALGQGVAFVPAKIGRLSWRAGTGVPHQVRARLISRAPHSLTAEFSLFDAEGRQIAMIREARFRSVRLSKAAVDHLNFLDYVGVPCPHPRMQAQAHPALGVNALDAALRDVVLDAAANGLHDRYVNEVDPLLESLCDRYAALALHKLSKGGRLTTSTLNACREAAPQCAPLLAWVMIRAERAGYLTPMGTAGWQVGITQDDEPSVADIWNSLLREYPDFFLIVHAAGRIGLHLPALLSGAKQFADVCPRDANSAALALQILGDNTRQKIGTALRECIAQAQSSRMVGQRIAVLEIGGFQPLFGQDICAGLDFAACDYMYASPSKAALDHASRLQERYPDAQTRLIDGTQPAEACADVVILHCDVDSPEALQLALQHAQTHLKPEGTLLMRGNHPASWLDFIFGADISWWVTDLDNTRTSVQYPVAYWQALLIQHGFHCEPLREFVPGSSSGPYLFIGSRKAPQHEAIPTAADGGWLLLAGDHPSGSRELACDLAAGFTERGIPVLVPENCGPDTLDAILLQALPRLGRIQGIVHLDGLALSSTPAQDPRQSLETQVRRCALAASLAQACERHHLTATLWLVTAGGAPFLADRVASADSHAALNDASLWNYGRTMANEAAGFSVRLIDLPQAGALPTEALIQELLAPDAEQEIALDSDGARHAPRLRALTPPRALALPQSSARTPGALRLGFDFPGQLRNLRWSEYDPPALRDDQLEISIQATGLNFRDVMYALGMLSDEAIENGFAGPTLGLEFAGIVKQVGSAVSGYQPGDPVVGFGPASFGNRVLTRADAIARIPDGMSFEAAATIPSTFFTIYYAMHHLARLEEGESVLIHGAAGGVGIAAIQYAQWRGAEIYATAGSDEKRDFLRLMGVRNIYDSRSLSYADEILAHTGGRGVDVVLNSLAGEAINRNLRVLKPFGRFLELGKRDFYENTRIGLRPFRNNISYFGIDADQLMSERPDLTRRLFAEVMALFHEGVLHPLPYCAFDANNVVDAFRYMQQARQIGKIVVTYRNGIHDVRPVATPRPSLALSAQATYLVTGGLSGFGLKTAQWLADKGARHLVLLSRSGPTAPATQQAIEGLRTRGVNVHAQACDVTDRDAVAAVLAHARQHMPPLRGVVHAAMVIDDGLIRSATAGQIRRVLAPKVLGAQHLDDLTRGLPLDFFVFYSSGTTLFGNPGQANYVAANGWLEALARQRRSQGLPATCVRWGAIDDVGYLARNKKIKDALQSRMGGSALSSDLALRLLEDILLADASDLGVLELDWRALTRFLPSANSPKFAWVARRAGSGDGDDTSSQDIAQMLATMDDETLHPLLMDMLKSEISEILRVPADKIDSERSIYDMGLDSLMGVELIVALENRFGIRLPVMTLSESATTSKLASKLIELLRSEQAQHAEQPAIASEIAQVVAQHADEDVPKEAVEQLTDALMATSNLPKQRMIH